MLSNNYKVVLSLLLLLFGGCSYEFPVASEPEPKTGTANLNNFVIVGGYTSAGFMDGALYSEAQNFAYPSLLGSHLEQNFGLEIYSSINFSSENGYNIDALDEYPDTPGRYELQYRSPTDNWPVRMPTEGEEIKIFPGELSSVSNLSLPRLKSYELDDEEALENHMYFEKIQNIQNGQSLLDIALADNPTLFLLEVGIDDILQYAVEGAKGSVNPDPDNIEASDLTPVSTFENSVSQTVARILEESEADLFLLNIPDPLLLPYFTKLPWYFTSDENLKFDYNYYSDFNIKVQNYNAGVSFSERRPVIVFDDLGGRPFKAKVIEDEHLPDARTSNGAFIPKYRQMTNEDYFLYNAEEEHYESIKTDTKFGSEDPIADGYVITETEAALITERRNNFNTILQNLADSSSRIYLIDFEGLVENIDEGRKIFKGVTFSLNFDYQGIISADGYTLNPRGQALLTNELIKQFNKVFNSKVPYIDVNSFRGNILRNNS